MRLKEHTEFVQRATERLSRDERLEGLAIGGSWIQDAMDEFADLDFVVAVQPARVDEVLGDRRTIAAGLGNLHTAFTGEHVGEPRLLICLYGNPLLHVDLKFVSLVDVARRVEDPAILWDRHGEMAKAMGTTSARFPPPDLQAMEDRFWVFIHYAATKLGRGENFEVVDFLAFLRDHVLGPLYAAKRGLEPRGVRRIDFYGQEDLQRFEATLCRNDRAECGRALLASVSLYRDLRAALATPDLALRPTAEEASVAYLQQIVSRLAPRSRS